MSVGFVTIPFCTTAKVKVQQILGHGKSSSYIAQLYEARCTKNWGAVPDLARKVVKYAPNRDCLALAAGINALVNSKSGEASYQFGEQEYGIPLDTALRSGKASALDILDGGVFRAALHLENKRYDLALTSIPTLVHRPPVPQNGTSQEAWAGVCVVLGTMVEGAALEYNGNTATAASTYRAILPYMTNVVALPSPCPELRDRSEELLTRIALFFSGEGGSRTTQSEEATQAFALLSQLRGGNKQTSLATCGTTINASQRQLLRVQYENLSAEIAQNQVPGSHSNNHVDNHTTFQNANRSSDRRKQVADLIRNEKDYETLLLKETRFPKADETNREVLSWIELVMNNWRSLCGPGWTDEDLGSGGKMAVGRRTLDVSIR